MAGWTGRLLLAAIAALTVVHGLVAAFAGLTEDEAYYRLWALSPAMSYLDHPPMVGWMIAAGRSIAGDNPFGIRLLALAGSLLGPFVLWRTARILFGPGVARRAVWFALAMPLLAVGSVVMTPDAPSVLFWGSPAGHWRSYVSQRANWWGVRPVRGFGLLSNHQPLRRRGRGVVARPCAGNWRWFRSWQWGRGMIAALLALPVWCGMQPWLGVVRKQFGRVTTGPASRVYFLELVADTSGLRARSLRLGLVGLWRVGARP